MIPRIARFCRIDASQELVERISKGSSFEKMKAVFSEVNKAKASRGVFVKKNHMRQGEVRFFSY